MNTLVTIGICGRNCERTISQAIISALRQDYDHKYLEIILVDDGSQDRSLELMKSLVAKTDIQTKIFSGKWQGIGKSRNTVIYNATGKYIIWLDSDEVLERDFVTKQVSVMERNPKSGIATANLRLDLEENSVLLLELIPAMLELCQQTWDSPTKFPGTGGSTYRVTASKQVGGFDDGLKGVCEDIELARRIRQAGWTIVNGDGGFFETHGGNFSSWSTLWKKYFKGGADVRRHFDKTNAFYSIYRINPFTSFVASISYAIESYKKTRLGLSFLLPVHFTFKMTAWFAGFTKG